MYLPNTTAKVCVAFLSFFCELFFFDFFFSVFFLLTFGLTNNKFFLLQKLIVRNASFFVAFNFSFLFEVFEKNQPNTNFGTICFFSFGDISSVVETFLSAVWRFLTLSINILEHFEQTFLNKYPSKLYKTTNRILIQIDL